MQDGRDEERFDRAISDLGIRIRDIDQRKVREDVFDEVTLLALYRLSHKNWFSALGGSISTGKEANVFLGKRNGQAVAIKIYRIRTADFRAMSQYLTGDRRFGAVRKTRKEIVFTWTRKEFANLSRAWDAGIPVPEPLVFDRNILIMQFLGDGERAYPLLKFSELPDPASTYLALIGMMERLFQKARLVHGDLSEFNILMGNRPYLIDMGQSVTPDHPQAMQFLIRDIRNVNRFFSRLCPVMEEQEIFTRICRRDTGNEARPREEGRQTYETGT